MRGGRPIEAGLAATAALLFVVVAAHAAHAAKPDWDRAANVKEAAERLSKLHKAKGSEAVLKFLDACYRTHALAARFSAALEGCMAQDYVHSRVLVAVYERVPEAVRAARKLPTPGAIAGAMNARFEAVIRQYSVAPKDVEAMKAAFETHGVPVFVASAFPNAGAGRDEGKSAGPGAPPADGKR